MRFWSRRRTAKVPEKSGTGDVGFPTSDTPHELPIEPVLDLHPFQPRDVLGVVDSYLEEAQRRGFAEVRLIHGKGTGFQRDRVHKLLAGHPRVLAFRDAPADRGHWGATLVRLRPRGSETDSPPDRDPPQAPDS